MTRMAVTGGAGFVGRHLVPRLAERHQVRSLIRGGSDLTPMPAGVETIHGDVRNPGTARSLLEGCEVVVHLAAGRAGGADVVDEVVGGTRSVLAAAGHAGVRRLIYVSCLGADAASHSPFLAAKWKAETFVRGSGVPYTILRSSLVVGRGDGILRPLADLVRRLPVVPIAGRGTRRVQPIDVRDLARCIEIAADAAALENEVVSVGGPMFLTFRQLVDLVEGELDVVKPKLLVPERLVPHMARLLPAAARQLYEPARLAQFLDGGVASPGIVPSVFAFEPRSIPGCLAEYLAK